MKDPKWPETTKLLRCIRENFDLQQLSSIPGDSCVKREVLPPLLELLVDSPVIIYAKYIACMNLDEVRVDEGRLSLIATPLMEIRNPGPGRMRMPERQCVFDAPWDLVALFEEEIGAAYAGWSVWLDNRTAMEIADLAFAGKNAEAIARTPFRYAGPHWTPPEKSRKLEDRRGST